MNGRAVYFQETKTISEEVKGTSPKTPPSLPELADLSINTHFLVSLPNTNQAFCSTKTLSATDMRMNYV